MVHLAAQWAKAFHATMVVHFEGDLGAGKTTFIRALIQALGYAGRVKSPTYGLLEHYPLDNLEVLHLDLYRIGDPDELEFLGIGDLADRNTVLLVEWPERGEGALPPVDAVLKLVEVGDKRVIYLKAHSFSGNQLCDSFHRLL